MEPTTCSFQLPPMKLADDKSDATAPQPSAQSETMVAYYRLDLEVNGEPNDSRPQFEPVLREGQARVAKPAPGAVVRGTLVDCPEAKDGIGCVVVDTGVETVAVQSAVLRHLVIEHAPCHLEFVAIPLQNHAGHSWWDWEAYEISPNGGSILVSDPRALFDRGRNPPAVPSARHDRNPTRWSKRQ